MLDTDTKSDTRTGRFLSLILRHKPDEIGIELDENGWANVGDILAGMDISMSTLERIVNENNKQRYSFNDDKTRIRANQGHSIEVDIELEECEPPEILFHGTATKFIPGIEESGLQRMSRNHVHLSDDVRTAASVGLRHSDYYTLITVDSEKMHKDGHKFYRSKNGVWLTDGVPREYLILITPCHNTRYRRK